MYQDILSDHGVENIGDPAPKFTVAECDKKHVIGTGSTMPNEEIVDSPANERVDFQEEPIKYRKIVGICIDDAENERFTSDQLPDSGARRTFSTGSVRDIRDGKGRFDLISPIALRSLAKRLEDGMSKYGERNWEKGQQLMSYLDSTIRHIYKFIDDTMKGREPEEDHIGAACWNLHAFIHTQEMIGEGWLPAELDDLPTPERVGLKKHGFTEDTSG